MHEMRLRDEARRLAGQGSSSWQVSRELGVPHTTVHRWITRRTPTDTPSPHRCFRDNGVEPGPDLSCHYAYLLGQYLGDGHLVTSVKVPVLRIYACTDYPMIMNEIRAAILAVRGAPAADRRLASTTRARKVESRWKHWPCLLPQHGPGRKHERPIILEAWQQEIVNAHPWPLIRGLIHSDGCRAMNRVVVHGVPYAYPRYFFSNTSRDILAIMGSALDRAGVAWRYNRPNSISIARREAFTLMDAHVGPKT